MSAIPSLVSHLVQLCSKAEKHSYLQCSNLGIDAPNVLFLPLGPCRFLSPAQLLPLKTLCQFESVTDLDHALLEFVLDALLFCTIGGACRGCNCRCRWW